MLPGLEQLVVQCAPQVAPVTMMALVKVESGGNPLAINVNGSRRLTRQPKSKAEAVAWAEWLVANGYSIDMGLTQVNSANLGKLRTSIGAMFDPCANLAAGANILAGEYSGAGHAGVELAAPGRPCGVRGGGAGRGPPAQRQRGGVRG